VIDSDFSTAELHLNIVRSIYLRTSKHPDRTLVETCSTRCSQGRRLLDLEAAGAYSKFEDRIFAKAHIGEVPPTAGCGENIQRMTLRLGIKRISIHISTFTFALGRNRRKAAGGAGIVPGAAQPLMSARTEVSERLDTTSHLNPLLHNAITNFTCVQLRLLDVLQAAARLTESNC
jgi:hypothetical protein